MLSYQTYFQNSSCNIDKTDAKCNDEATDGDNLFSRLTIPLLVLELILSLSDLLSDTFSGLSLTSLEETFGWWEPEDLCTSKCETNGKLPCKIESFFW